MKKTLLAALSMAFAFGAQADSYDDNRNFYVQGTGGVQLSSRVDVLGTTLDIGTGPMFSVEGGVKAIEGEVMDLRLGPEFVGVWTDIDSISVGGVTVPAPSNDVTYLGGYGNAYIDFKVTDRFRPYVGIGFGGTNIEASGTIGGVTLSDSDWVLGAQVKTGVAYQATPRVALLAGYRYRTFGDMSTTVGNIDIPNTHSIEGGVRVSF